MGLLASELPKGGGQAGEIKSLSLRMVQSVARFTQDGKVRFFVAEPADRGTDPLAALKFEAGSSSGVGKDAFRGLHALGSMTFKKVETGHADTFELKPDEVRQRDLRDWIKSVGTVLIVAVPEDAEVTATCFGAGAETEGNRPPLSIEGESVK